MFDHDAAQAALDNLTRQRRQEAERQMEDHTRAMRAIRDAEHAECDEAERRRAAVLDAARRLNHGSDRP